MHILFACPLHDPDAWVPRLQAAMPGCRISVWDPEGPPSGAEAALVWRPPAELFAHEQGIRTLFNLGAGVDALLKMKEIPPQVSIVRLEDAGMSVQMAEYALYALLRVSRDFQAFDEAQARQHWDTREGTRPADWPVGVLGLGQVGARVAQTLAGFGYPVAGWSRTPRDLPGVQSYAGEQALPAFLARTRFLVNVLPLTPGTVGILNRDTLSQLLPDAHLVNVGRGDHLVEEDLVEMLEEGEIAGATLDVFRTEPLPKDHPFWRDPRVHVTPHIAARTLRDESIAQIAAKVAQLMRGEPISGVVGAIAAIDRPPSKRLWRFPSRGHACGPAGPDPRYPDDAAPASGDRPGFLTLPPPLATARVPAVGRWRGCVATGNPAACARRASCRAAR